MLIYRIALCILVVTSSISFSKWNVIETDTLSGDHYFAIAEKFYSENLYDSSSIYYMEAGKLYSEEKQWAKHLISLNYSAIDFTQLSKYEKAEEIYNNDYVPNYQLSAPRCLPENLLTTANYMGQTELNEVKDKYPDVELISYKEKNDKAEIYFIHYNGKSPEKKEETIKNELFGIWKDEDLVQEVDKYVRKLRKGRY